MDNLTLKVRPGTYRRSDAVTFEPDCVVKSVTPDLCAIEAWRTELGRGIGLATGAFYTPEIKAIDADSITLERLDGLVNIRERLNRRDGPDIARKVGAALAEIHGVGAADINWRDAPDGARDFVTASAGFYHGDFNTYNVLYDGPNDRLCVLDWLNPAWARGHSFARDRYFDLCVFILSTFSRRWLEAGVVKQPEEITDQFLWGYANNIDGALDCDELYETFSDVLAIFAAPRGGVFARLAKIIRWPSFGKTKRYCANLATRNFPEQ